MGQELAQQPVAWQFVWWLIKEAALSNGPDALPWRQRISALIARHSIDSPIAHSSSPKGEVGLAQ